MKFHKQTILHDPDNGQYGDCYRTALACVLDLEPDDVPHFVGMHPEDPEALWSAVRGWLNERELDRFTVGYECDIETLFRWMAEANPKTLYLLAGESPRGTAHQVVAYHDAIIHDPHPDGGGLIGPCKEDGCFWIDVITARLANQEPTE